MELKRRWDKKLMLLALTVTVVCLVAGFSAGYEYATGRPVLDIWKTSKSIAPPAEIVATTLDTTTNILASQPQQTYQEGYNCLDFAWGAMRTLQWQGQPSAIIRLGYSDGSGHALLLVPTSDKGYQFIEPQDNEVVHPEIGLKYQGQTVIEITVLKLTWVPLQTFENAPTFGEGR